jgi:hypothetical protein
LADLDLAALDRIEALRQQATRGPWQGLSGTVYAPRGVVADCVNDEADAAYLAALSPEVVGALLRLARERLEQAERIERLEQKYRARLWLGHGHLGVYGDDGEMQCSECAPFGAWDYKRDPLEAVEKAECLAKLDIMAKAAATGKGRIA